MKTNKVIIIVTVAILAGLGGGYAIGYNEAQPEPVEHSHTEHEGNNEHDHSHDSGEHKHEPFNVPKEQAPTVTMTVTEDAKSGWNIHLDTTYFTFTGQNANKENVIGEGHAHLYVDGKVVSRIYGPDFHYNGHFDGTKTFKVTLNGNNHSDYTVDGQVVSSEVQVTHQH